MAVQCALFMLQARCTWIWLVSLTTIMSGAWILLRSFFIFSAIHSMLLLRLFFFFTRWESSNISLNAGRSFFTAVFLTNSPYLSTFLCEFWFLFPLNINHRVLIACRTNRFFLFSRRPEIVLIGFAWSQLIRCVFYYISDDYQDR